MRELSSAIGMNSSGERNPNPGRSQRTRASAPITLSSASDTIGWYRTRSSWSVMARPRALRTENFASTDRCMELVKTVARALPWSFASYMARSACPSRSSAVAAASAVVTRPMLALTMASWSPIGKGAASWLPIRAAMAGTIALSDRSEQTTTNSSLPRRATTSLGRMQARMRWLASTRSSSPTACPRLSLTCLKPSRSMNRTARPVPSWAHAPRDWPRCRMRAARLGSPVSVSCRA